MSKKFVLTGDRTSGSVLIPKELSITDLTETDINTATLANGQSLVYNGTNWINSTGSSGSFDLSADSGTDKEISSGDTLQVSGGTGISTITSDVDTVTINLDNTSVTSGSYTNADITIDAQGRITAASNGSLGLTDVVDDTTPQLGGTLDANSFDIDMGTNIITDVKVGQWDTSYSWGDHSSAGYLQNVVEDTTPELGGDLVCDDGTAVSSSTTTAAHAIYRTQQITFRSGSGASYVSGGQITQYSNARKIFLNPAHTINSIKSSVVIGKIGDGGITPIAGDVTVDNGFTTNISKVEADTGSSLVLSSNLSANTSFIQINHAANIPITDDESNRREGIELRVQESATAVESVSIKSMTLNATNGIGSSRSPELRLYNKDDLYVSLKAPVLPVGVSVPVDFVLPNTTGSANQVLKTDGSGNLDWTDQTSLTSFTVSADSGTDQTIEDSDTLEIAGGTGISTVASATDTVTINLDNIAGLTSGSYTNADITVDAQGRITSASNGSAGLTDVVDDTTPQLGGNLDLNSNDITGTGEIDITGNVAATTFVGSLNGAVQFDAEAAVALTKGEVVYVSGLSGNTPIVNKARANSSSTMPAFGIVAEDISINNTGKIITFGSKEGLDAADFRESVSITFSLGDTLYVSAATAGKLTNVAPSGESNLIQNIGRIERASPSTNITIKVGGAGRTNATPALNNGNIFIGNSSNNTVTTSLQTQVESYSINNLVEDTTPQLGGTLDANGNSIDMGTNTITDAKVGQWDTSYGWGDHSLAGYLQNVVEDTSPQLGGNLDVNGRSIVSVSNADINISPDGTGKLLVNSPIRVREGVHERIYNSYSSVTGTFTYNCSNAKIFYHASSQITGDVTANFSSLNLDVGYGTVTTIIIQQGTSARDILGVQIDGTAQTVSWEGGSAPTGNASSLDVITFSIFRYGSGATNYVVMGQLMNFG